MEKQIPPKVRQMLEIAQKNMNISKIKNNEEIIIEKVEENKNERSEQIK